jgi:integrase
LGNLGNGVPYSERALQALWYRACKAAGVSGYQFRDIRKRAINEARERGDATAFAGHKDPRTTHRNYFTEAAEVKRSGLALSKQAPYLAGKDPSDV